MFYAIFPGFLSWHSSFQNDLASRKWKRLRLFYSKVEDFPNEDSETVGSWRKDCWITVLSPNWIQIIWKKMKSSVLVWTYLMEPWEKYPMICFHKHSYLKRINNCPSRRLKDELVLSLKELSLTHFLDSLISWAVTLIRRAVRAVSFVQLNIQFC